MQHRRRQSSLGALLVTLQLSRSNQIVDDPRPVQELQYGLSFLYPTPVVRLDMDATLPDGTREALREAIVASYTTYNATIVGASDYKRNAPNDGFFAHQQQVCGEGGHASEPNDWIASPAAQAMLLAFRDATATYLEKVFYKARFSNADEILSGLNPDQMHVWASFHSKCSSHSRHVHPDALVSGVYYVSVPSGAGHLTFADPRGLLPPFERTMRNTPREGDLFMFPPWLGHEVESSCGGSDADGPRISVSFNYNDPQVESFKWGLASAGVRSVAAQGGYSHFIG